MITRCRISASARSLLLPFVIHYLLLEENSGTAKKILLTENSSSVIEFLSGDFMKKLILICMVVFVFMPSNNLFAWPAKVVEVRRGDVLIVQPLSSESGDTQKIDLYKVNCPKKDEPFFNKAIQNTIKVAKGREVNINQHPVSTPKQMSANIFYDMTYAVVSIKGVTKDKQYLEDLAPQNLNQWMDVIIDITKSEQNLILGNFLLSKGLARVDKGNCDSNSYLYTLESWAKRKNLGIWSKTNN